MDKRVVTTTVPETTFVSGQQSSNEVQDEVAAPRKDESEPTTMINEFLCTGDYVCLYCEETEGYVFSWQSSSVHNRVYIFNRQDRKKPEGIPNPHVVVFELCIQNRYKLNKKYRKLLEGGGEEENGQENFERKAILSQAKNAAQAENDDNVSEQKRQHGKRVRYGEVIQLKHVFTNKFIHVSTTQTSRRDKNNMMVCLQSFNAKHSQFRILPRYKVKSEGEVVQIFDQIVFESVKSPGQYFHASVPFNIDHFHAGSELNLGVEQTGFTIMKYYKPIPEERKLVRGGSVLRLFHKELEAYLVAEGLFDETLIEEAHMRIREIDQMNPTSLYPSSSGITYWQIESEQSILSGDVVRWEQQVRFRHMTTRLFLSINDNREVALTREPKDPNTVFRLHPIIKEGDEIVFETYARIEHVISGFWLHALRDEEYKRKQMQGVEDDDSMKGLRWDGASLRKISASGERIYHDAYTIQRVSEDDVAAFNSVAGMVPFMLNLIQDRRDSRSLTSKKTTEICTALTELKDFMYVNSVPTKRRQKLMRNLRIIDLLVRLLQFPLEGAADQTNLTSVFKAAYDTLHAYMIGNSRKNALYFAKYIDFFQTQFSVKGDIGLNVAQMIVELIRDNRKIVDRITRQQVDEFVNLLRENKNYRYLDLLNVLCVCDNVAIPDNQTYITEHWLMKDQSGVFLTECGQNLKLVTNVVYISTDIGDTWVPLHQFIDKDHELYTEDESEFLMHQLDLFKTLCYGRNDFAIHVISRELNYLTWEEAFLCLRLELLPHSLRAKYCDLIVSLFVDVGNNYSVLDYTNITFVYEDIDETETVTNSVGSGELIVKDLVTIFPVLRDWIMDFIGQNVGTVASNVGHNILIEKVLRLLHYLVKFGYYGNNRDIEEIQVPLLNLIDGKKDKPFDVESEKGLSKQMAKLLDQYRKKDRYEQSPETTAIVNAKHMALQVLDLLLIFQFGTRLKTFVSIFKQVESSDGPKKTYQPLEPLLNSSYKPLDTNKKSLRDQKRMAKILRDMFDKTAYFNKEQLTGVLLDLNHYKYDKMVTKSLAVLNRYFSAKMDMFSLAVEAQVLITPDSIRVNRELIKYGPILRRLCKAKLNDVQVKTVSSVLDILKGYCSVPYDVEEPHPINQSILINHEVFSVVFDYLSQEIDAKLVEQYRGTKTIVIKSIRLLKALARANPSVQKRIYERMDTLLRLPVVESEISCLLIEAFKGNHATCMKVQPKQIEKIIQLIGVHHERVPELLLILTAIVKVEGLDMPLKRNQSYVMKFIMQSYNKVGYLLDQPRERRERILTGRETENDIKYLVNLVDLLATCAEGENRFIESLCQTILSLDEILHFISHRDIGSNIKKSYVKYLHWVYMKSSASIVDTGAAELTHDTHIWNFLRSLQSDVRQLTDYITSNRETIPDLLRSKAAKGALIDPSYPETVHHATLHLLLDSGLIFLRTFCAKFYSADKESHPDEPDLLNKIANNLLELCDAIKPYVTKAAHLKIFMSAMTVLLPAASVSQSRMDTFIEDFGSVQFLTEKDSQVQTGHAKYYAEEISLNKRFRTFAVNCSLTYGGHNTVAAQLKYTRKWAAQNEYTELGTDEALPLGEEFQEHIRCFIRPGMKKVFKTYQLVEKIIQQLGISSDLVTHDEATRMEQEKLDIKCLQLLRAMVHNEIVKLSDDWEERPAKSKRQLARIKELQNAIVEMGVIPKSLPLLARSSDDTARETLAFLARLLFNANAFVQQGMLDYFHATREETFFLAIRNRMQLSSIAIKERRALQAQKETMAKEAAHQAKNVESRSSTPGQKAMQEIDNYEANAKRTRMKMSKRASLADLQFKASKHSGASSGPAADAGSMPPDVLRAEMISFPPKRRADSLTPRDDGTELNSLNHSVNNRSDHRKQVHFEDDQTDFDRTPIKKDMDVRINIDDDYDNMALNVMPESEDAVGDDAMEYKDEGYIELVLQVLSRMCDGQFAGLQNYLREQPDNIKSFNICAETTAFLNLVYSNITASTIDLVTILFSTLIEFCTGNQANRYVILNGKVVDYINFILRAGDFHDCPYEKIVLMRRIIGGLLLALVEENGPEPLTLSREVKDTIDKEALYRIMGECYEKHMIEKPLWRDYISLEKMKNPRVFVQSVKKFAQDGREYVKKKMDINKPGLREALTGVGFTYYFLLARFHDIDPNLNMEESNITPIQEAAYRYYKKNTMSIELLKDDHIQKVHFRVKNKNVLREEVKEKLKWNVDRSSASTKIRDLMAWSKDILKDIYYQRRMLANPIAAFLTKYWLLWNYMVIILSIVINSIMLWTWDAAMALDDLPDNATDVPADIFEDKPNLDNRKLYFSMLYILGGTHNFFSILVLVSYFLSNNPSLPDVKKMIHNFRNRHNDDDDDDQEEELVSELDVQFFSAKTFYYLLFMLMSILGTAYYGYCFAFHLINIVNNNQLLSGVIQAVTQNGKSLLWVAILGLVVFYLYAIVAFAFFRDVFDPAEQQYCGSLWECTITLIRYGLIGDYNDFKKKYNADFWSFALFSIYQVSFFILITTIGLNIIFGIIVDTFSELRDLKWTAESDMRDRCFICNRNSYEFEHHGEGFHYHVKNEHNMWAYIFFFIHLDDTKPNEYTCLDLHIAGLLRQERYDFFPIDRALALSTLDGDSTDSKIDDLLQYVLTLVQKQKEEIPDHRRYPSGFAHQESERKRQEERVQQRRWQERHKQKVTRSASGRAGHSESIEAEAALRRFMQIRDTGRPDWVTVQFESTHL